MPIQTFDQYIAAAKQAVRLVKTASRAAVAVSPFTTLDLAGDPGAGSLAIGNTASGLVPTSGQSGFPVINAFGGGATGYLWNVEYGNTVASRLLLYDRLFHVGSISATALATTNLSAQPSYASRLPNTDYTLASDLYVEVNAAISNTATTVTVTYTNQSGTAGRSTGAVSIQNLTAGRLVLLPLQAGDTGIQKIESVTVGGTVATAGSFNIVVGRLLWMGRVRFAGDGDNHGPDRTGIPVLYAASALWLVVSPDSTGTGIPELLLTVANA